MSRILVLDDDPHILRTLEIMLHDDGHQVWGVQNAESALTFLEKESVDIALVDLMLPGMSGLEFLRKLREMYPDTDAIMITAHGSIETAVSAMREGAFDYLTKPFSPDQVRHRIQQAERMQGYRSEVSGLRRLLGQAPWEQDFLTRNEAMRNVLELACKVAESDAPVLITGESGTGKSLLANLIHKNSPRSDGPFAVVDCASFHETLLESELFGHTRGAFTGAVADKPGKVEAAQQGSLFLDEVGEIPLHMQSKLLRLIEERTFERLGDPAARTMDARIIAATNRDIGEMVAEKEFREDLYYRLNVVELAIPPLRNRVEDIPALVQRFLGEFDRAHGRQVQGLAPDVEEFLMRYNWPGNVRELAHVMERAVLICTGDAIAMDHLPARMFADQKRSIDRDGVGTLAEIEETHLRKALSLGFSLEETARMLGIDPSTLWRKRKKFGL